MKDPRFRDDVADFQWTVAQVKQDAFYLDRPFVTLTYKGRYGLPTRGPSANALREAAALIERGLIGRHVIDSDLVITIDGLGDRDRVSILEGSEVGDQPDS